MPIWLHSLKFQVTAMLLALTGLFAVSSYYVLDALRIERQDDALLSLGSEMRLIGQQLPMQAMNYKDNAPRDYQTYYRDLRLYYRDLMDKTERMTKISSVFSGNQGTSHGDNMMMEFSEAARNAAAQLSRYWSSFDAQLRQRVGDNPEEPRLEWAAEFIFESGAELQEEIARFWAVLEATAQHREVAAARLYRGVLAVTVALTVGILWWFYFRVLRPLGHTMRAVKRVAAGDFSHKIPIETHNEIGGLNAAFNQLSGRLNTLLRLLTQLQGGSDLEETLGIMSKTLPDLIPVDWTGILFLTPDGCAQLEAACLDGATVATRLRRFPATDTPLETALDIQQPQRIHELQGLAASDSRYGLIRHLSTIGMRDAVFMPIKDQSAMPGVLVFASREVNAYSAEQVALLSNLALLITLSFGKTLKLVERARLAAIGQFVSGIAHEIRNPLATITLAIDHLRSVKLPPKSAKRVDLAAEESARMARLLDEMLLYSKPMRLDLKPLRLGDLIDGVAAASEVIRSAQPVEIEWPSEKQLALVVEADAYRLRQVLVNLIQNAIDASREGARVCITVQEDPARNRLEIAVTNRGSIIPTDQLHRIFDPFFSTKPSGTGLGLGIVRRITHAHGGEVTVTSDLEDGTTFSLYLPLS